MVTMRWAEKQPGIPKKVKAIIIKDDGTELELTAAYVKTMNNDDTYIKGDCITVPRFSVPNECHIGEVTGFHFSGDSEPTGINWRQWKIKEQEWGFYNNSLQNYDSNLNKISKIECPVECKPQNGGKKNRRNRRRTRRNTRNH